MKKQRTFVFFPGRKDAAADGQGMFMSEVSSRSSLVFLSASFPERSHKDAVASILSFYGNKAGQTGFNEFHKPGKYQLKKKKTALASLDVCTHAPLVGDRRSFSALSCRVRCQIFCLSLVWLDSLLSVANLAKSSTALSCDRAQKNLSVSDPPLEVCGRESCRSSVTIL